MSSHNGIQASLSMRAKTIMRLWRVVRKDGAQFLFCEGRTKIVFNSETYLPAGGLDAGDLNQRVGVNHAESDFSGLLTVDAITDTDLANGLYDGARIYQYDVDPSRTYLGALDVAVLFISNVRWDDTKWRVETNGLSHLLDRVTGKTASRKCDWTLGEAFGETNVPGCKVDIETLKSSAVAVASVIDDDQFTLANTLNGTPTDHYFAHGFLVWKTGPNAGARSTVKSYTASTRTVKIALPPEATIAVGHTVDIYPGCDKTFATCTSRFSNYLNFGGLLHLLGTDEMLRSV